MEDIYADLHNYEDVNAVQELRSENEELKVKLEEHSAAMAKLQKDYDTLEMEFKKLENNYSSLLMTARSEIQRKTQRIAQLNTEKDLMVLEALKSGKKIRRNFNQAIKNPSTLNCEKPSEKINNKNKGNTVQQKKVVTKHERHENPDSSHGYPAKDIPDPGTYNKNKLENTKTKVLKELSDNINENSAQHKTDMNEPSKTYGSSNEDRRRSIPIDKYNSSDDEFEQNYKTKDTIIDHFRIDNERRNSNKMPIDRHSNITSETSSVEDRGHNYHESTLRDTYKGRSSRHYDNSSYKSRDKYDVSLKHRKHYSPERGQKRQHREYQDDYHRYEQARYQGKSLESPPPEFPSRHQRRKSVHRSDYDRYSNDHEKNRHHHDDKYSSKYRLKDDEPHAKRRRAESYGNPEAHFKEDRRHYHEKESMDAKHGMSLALNTFSPHEYDMLRFSCQSPDFVHTDVAFEHPTKEIMATADTPLEDPRLTSKRYAICKENGKETLSTAVGRNIDIKSVNKALWNITPVDMPFALVRRPSQCSDDLIKDIYMDIDNPVTNLELSLESGVVHEFDDENAICSKPKVVQHDIKRNKQLPVDLSKQATNIEKVSRPSLPKCRISNVGQDNKNALSNMDIPIIELGENVPHHKNIYNKKGAAEETSQKELPSHKQKCDKHEDCVPNDINYSKVEIKKSKSREKCEIQNQATLTKMAIVADDLQLSDDNSDHMDTIKKVVPEKKKCEMPSNIKETKTDDTINNIENKMRTAPNVTETGKTVDTAEIKKDDDKTIISDSTKKHKFKKKKSKSKEISNDLAQTTDITEKKTKSKREKESKPKETKEKFSDLFGDSSSLMTPEDLGIPSYLPISEDAQDAVDLKINQIIDAASPIDKGDYPSHIQTRNGVEFTTQETIAHDNIAKDVLHKSNIEVEADKEIKDINKKKNLSKNYEETIDPNQLPSPIVYENLNPGTDLNDPNVVKTVIISTGKQPEISYENNIEVTKLAPDVEVNAKQNTANINPCPAIQGLKCDILKALATSTPQKELTTVNPLAASVGTDHISDPNVSKAVATIPNAEKVANEAESNTLASNDAPDVRIFVKRRRKVVKRPPMT